MNSLTWLRSWVAEQDDVEQEEAVDEEHPHIDDANAVARGNFCNL